MEPRILQTGFALVESRTLYRVLGGAIEVEKAYVDRNKENRIRFFLV